MFCILLATGDAGSNTSEHKNETAEGYISVPVHRSVACSNKRRGQHSWTLASPRANCTTKSSVYCLLCQIIIAKLLQLCLLLLLTLFILAGVSKAILHVAANT